MDLKELEKEAFEALDQIKTLPDMESLYTRYLGRKEGQLTKILRSLGSLPPEEKKAIGREANQLRTLLEEKISLKKKTLEDNVLDQRIKDQQIDLTLPGRAHPQGRSHPILQTIDEICDIFKSIGFQIVVGPDIETDFHNFTALNIPQNHPARDMHDTFYLNLNDSLCKQKNQPLLLRTHTSPVQIQLMKKVKPPVRIVAPGRVYRHEAIDATHAAIFHQIEGLVIDEKISFADLKGTLSYFVHQYFGKNKKVRFRPSYFPFVEPGAEMDMEWPLKKGSSASNWMEILGAGMVHPQVLRNVGYDPKKYTGFAFGMGIERIVMARYQIPDIRYFLESDLRFLEQF
ncbi:phenylalanine--tRNA ligase subunit alpha [bacterium F11]|nr:phenylalanine--tRNA ligase subunit alpha [bacterium F11]